MGLGRRSRGIREESGEDDLSQEYVVSCRVKNVVPIRNNIRRNGD